MSWAVLAAVLPFSAGVILLQQQAALPSLAWALLLVPLAAVGFRHRAALIALSFGAGFFWAVFCAGLRMDDRLAPALEGRDLEVVGVVSGLPAPGERGVRFELEVESSRSGERLPSRLLLWWYRTPSQEGEAA